MINFYRPKYKFISKTRIKLTEDWVTPYGVIPVNEEFNGADVPWYFLWFVTKFGILFFGSIFHDYYYREALVSKRYADTCFWLISEYFATVKFSKKPIRLWIAIRKIHIAHFAVTNFGKGNY